MDDRRDEIAREWGVAVERWFETASSVIAYGRRGGLAVVLKVVKNPGDEWRSGEVSSAFDGRGVVRVHEWRDGAMLLERLDPGEPLAQLSLSGGDEDATAILADVIGAMSATRSVAACPTVQDWGRGFDRYRDGGDEQIPPELISQAAHLYAELGASQRSPRLLHGDLQHYNVLSDRRRGWVAIDPKGVIGEIEYELGAALRNPVARPTAFADRAIIERRLGQFAAKLGIDVGRALGWAFAQAVLSAIWEVEDGAAVDARHPSIMLATVIRPMLEQFD